MDPSAKLKPQIALLFIYISIPFVHSITVAYGSVYFFKLEEFQGREAASI